MEQLLTAYTIKEVSERILVPSGTLRQWEVDFKGLIDIPRDAKGARYYTEVEIEQLTKIKEMREKNLSKGIIRELLAKRNTLEQEETRNLPQTNLPQPSSELETTLHSLKEMMAGFDEFKATLIQEVKEEIRQEVRREVIEDVRKEIASGSEAQQQLLHDRAAQTSEQIEGLSEALVEMEERYQQELQQKDELMQENIRLLEELREANQKKGFWGRLFAGN